MQHLISCRCGEVILKSLDVDTKVRGVKVVVFRDDGAYAVCKSCNAEVKIPLRIDTDLLKSMSSSSPRRDVALYIREMNKKT